MASQRTKRTIKAPKKYVEAEVEVDEDSPSPKREVLRLVREDEADDLLDKVVYIQWTENDEFHGDWFRAKIKKFDPVKKLANIWYTETKEAEKGTDLRNLIAQGTIAFREERSKSHKLRKDEVELPEKIDPEPDEDDDSQYETSDDEGDEEDDSEGGGDDDDVGDDDGGDDDVGEDHGSGKGRKRSRSRKEEDSGSDDEEDKGGAGAPGSKKGAESAGKADDGELGGPPVSSASNGRGQAAAKRAKVDVSSSRPAAPMPSKRQVTPSTKAQELLAASKDDEDMRAVERASKQLLASILGKKAAAAPTQQFYSGSPAKLQPRQSAPSAPPKLAKSASNVKETEFRDKASTSAPPV